MKKGLSLVLAATLAMGIFTGCAQTSTTGDTSWDYIQQKGEIVVGLDPTFAPMGFTDDKGEIIGFDVDLTKAVGEKLGVKIKLQPIDWDSKEMELNGKKIDVIWNGMSKTPEREENMILSKPYLNNTIIIMTKKGSTIKTKADLVGKKLAVQAESAGLEVIEADAMYSQIKDKLTQYKSYDEAIMDLEIGRVDAIIIDKVLGKYKDIEKPNTYEFGTEDFGEDFYVIGLRKEDKAFADKIQSTLDEIIKDGTATKTSLKWFNDDIVIK